MPKKMGSKKGKSKGGKRKKGGKKKKEKKEINPPPLHILTELYNKLRDKLFELRSTQTNARKKRLEGWYMTREMLSMKHDNDVYHDYLKEKMNDVQNLIQEITIQLEKERSEVDKLIKERMSDYDKKMIEFKNRIQKGETQLTELRIQLQEYEPLIKKLAGILARLRELQALIPAAELDANVKTRHLKNQYLGERAKLHNHLESELYTLITTCRSHLMPILANHMHNMEQENKCNRWDLGRLDITNAKLCEKKELLLEKRNRLNMERSYLSIEWAFGKLNQCEARRKKEMQQRKHPVKAVEEPPECELSIAFKEYLNKRLVEERQKQKKEAILKRNREERLKKLALDKEKSRKILEQQKKLFESEEEEGDEDMDYDGEGEEMEYYEDEFGNIIVAPLSRMLQHKALMENRALEELENEEEEEEEEEEESESGSGESDDDDAHDHDSHMGGDDSDSDSESDDGLDDNSSSEDDSDDDAEKKPKSPKGNKSKKGGGKKPKSKGKSKGKKK